MQRMKTNARQWLPLGLVFPLLVWALLDKAIWPWDQSWYGAEAANLWYILIRHAASWPEVMVEVMRIKAPLIVWVGQFFVPLGYALGSVESGLLIMLAGCHLLSLWMLLRIGEKLGSRGFAMAGVVAAAAGPLFLAMGQQFFVEAMQLTAVCYFFWLAVCGRGWNPWRLLGHLIMATSLAMGAKVSSPLYAWFPGLLASLWMMEGFMRRDMVARTSLPFATRALLTSSVIALLMVGAWYLRNWTAITGFLSSATAGDLSVHYGVEKSWLEGVGFWVGASGRAFLLSWTGIAAGLLCLAALFIGRFGAVFRSKEQPSGDDSTPAPILRWVVLGSVLQLVVILLVFSRQINEETRYLLPALPSLFCLFMGISKWMPMRWPAFALTAVMAIQWLYLTLAMFGWQRVPHGVTPLFAPVHRDVWDRYEMNALESFLFTRVDGWGHVLCLVDTAQLNPAVLNFYSAQMRPFRSRRVYYSLPVWAPQTIEEVVPLIHSEATMAQYVLTFEPQRMPPPDDPLNLVAREIQAYVASNPDFERVVFYNRFGVMIYRNTVFTDPY
jgi:hypothetical protein